MEEKDKNKQEEYARNNEDIQKNEYDENTQWRVNSIINN